ncbi:hypothetical protein FOZ60_004782 [Perkinsus olseni]|uniref:Isocitrate lyase n=1 Tax=Perkinsus olseni TaxID=32597 RepID=A0A7J6NSD9_PEROL|nr:hypothetical protein FOZ60_004782 [Perkinsus olseni]
MSHSPHFEEDVAELKQWWSSSRWKGKCRPYSAEDVARLRGNKDTRSTYPSNAMAKKLWSLLVKAREEGTSVKTLGVLDPVQAIQVSKYLDALYISGPDFGDYPSNTVPDKVEQIFRAQCFHDKSQLLQRSSKNGYDGEPLRDFLAPIVADGDSGHGGITAVMRLAKMMIEKGAAGIHLEDQKASTKKCGHLGGKVLVSTREHIERLVAARLTADILGTDTIIIARTDAEIATLLDNNVDDRDHPFILGASNPEVAKERPMRYIVEDAINSGCSDKIPELEAEWIDKARLCTFPELISMKLKEMGKPTEEWDEKSLTMGIHEMRLEAQRLLGGNGELPYWSWDAPRTREGFYRIQGGTKMCISRSSSFAPYSDMTWMEAKKPDLAQAKEFTTGVKEAHSGAMFLYNVFPSLFWDKMGMSDEDIADFQRKLGELGFVFQFIPLAGFHVSGLHMDLLAKNYRKEDMLAYMRDVQRVERDNGIEILAHQKWSGADYIDTAVSIATGGSAATTTTSRLAGISTERDLEELATAPANS